MIGEWLSRMWCRIFGHVPPDRCYWDDCAECRRCSRCGDWVG